MHKLIIFINLGEVNSVFWVVKPCNVAVGYQCFRGLWCLHLQGEVHGAGKRHTDMEYKRGQSPVSSRKQKVSSSSQWKVGKDSDTTARRGTEWCIRPATKGRKCLVEHPVLTNRDMALIATLYRAK